MSLLERLGSGGFAVTAELSPPRGASVAQITAAADGLRDWVDAVNVTDNQGSHVRLASWAGSLAVLAAGLDPVLQMTCRTVTASRCSPTCSGRRRSAFATSW